jgi:hypothetical protein
MRRPVEDALTSFNFTRVILPWASQSSCRKLFTSSLLLMFRLSFFKLSKRSFVVGFGWAPTRFPGQVQTQLASGLSTYLFWRSWSPQS